MRRRRTCTTKQWVPQHQSSRKAGSSRIPERSGGLPCTPREHRFSRHPEFPDQVFSQRYRRLIPIHLQRLTEFATIEPPSDNWELQVRGESHA